MPVPSKIQGSEMVDKLKDCYLNKKMSTTEISKQSEQIFGIKIGGSTIYKELLRHSIPLRNKSESVSRALSTLNVDQTYINESVIEWIDGFLLGDGYINFNKETHLGARFVISSVKQEWSQYAISYLVDYGNCEINNDGRVDLKHPNVSYTARTLTHPDIVAQARRWYSGINCTKKVPQDVRITPTSLLLWYLGDGSLTYVEESNTYIVRFATCAFSVEDIETILMPKMVALGLECSRDKSKNDIRICASSIGRFFDIIGHKSPIACYDYKFAIADWVRLIRLSDIVQNDKQKWMAQYYYKTGQLDCSKSPGGKMLLFTEEQANKLKQKLQIV